MMVSAAPSTGIRRSFPGHGQDRKRYVMRGDPRARALDVYHLIVAPTHACNLRCVHCYLPDHGKTLLPRETVLGLVDEWSQIVLSERGRYGGIFHVKGGEPFVVPYFWDVVSRVTSLRSLQFMITTNGTFSAPPILHALAEANTALDGMITVVVSLDGPSDSQHALLRGPGQFERTMGFVRALRASGIAFHLNCVVHRRNVAHLREYVVLAKEHGASQVNFLAFVPRGIGTGMRELHLPHGQLADALECLYSSLDEGDRELLAGSLPHLVRTEDPDFAETPRQCVAGYSGMFYVTPDGSAFTCPNIVAPEYAVGNVTTTSLRALGKRLDALRTQLDPHQAPYTCVGELLHYARAGDRDRYDAVRGLITHLEAAEVPRVGAAYCYSRNW